MKNLKRIPAYYIALRTILCFRVAFVVELGIFL